MKKNKKKINRKKRMFQQDELVKRIKKNQEKAKGYKSNVFKDDLNVSFYFPKEGTHIIDIIPYFAGSNDPAVEEGAQTYTFEYQMHRLGPNNIEYVCPRMYGKKCPACEHREKLRENDDDNYKKWWPKTRNMYNVISYDDKKETKKGVQVWDVANFYFEKPLMAISRKPSRQGKEDKTVNFIDPENGKSISFTVEKAKSKDDYPKYVGHAFDDRNYEIDIKILKTAHALDELVQLASYEEMKNAMFSGEDEDDKKKKTGKKAKKKKSLEEVVEGLLEDLDEIEDLEDLAEFVEENEIDIEIDEDGKFRKEKKKVKKQIEEMLEDEEDEDDEDDEDEDRSVPPFISKEDEDEDEEEDDEDEDEDEDEEDDEEDELRETLEKMSFIKLKKYVKKHKLDIDLSYYGKSDKDDLIEEIIEEQI